MQSDSYKRLTTLSCQRCSKDYQPTINKDGSIRKTKGEFCSQWCRSASGKSVVLASTKKLEPIPCKNCGEMFKPRKEKYGRGSFCSRKCFNDCKEIKMPNSQLAAELRTLLRIASRPVVESRSMIVLKEMAGLLRIQRANKEKKQKLGKVASRVCNHCNKIFKEAITMGRPSKYCGRCKPIAYEIIQTKLSRIGKAVRRARTKKVAYECIDPMIVFKRDRWKCHICGTKTPEKLRGTYNANAPELDHISTLAEGGSHTYGNVACACRSCNQKKGSRSYGQLKFF